MHIYVRIQRHILSPQLTIHVPSQATTYDILTELLKHNDKFRQAMHFAKGKAYYKTHENACLEAKIR